MNFRSEKDSLGEVQVPADKLWGAQTQRSLDNFSISSRRFPLPFLRALLEQKRATAIVNAELGELEGKIAAAIVAAADEFLEQGLHLEQFPLDIFQTGSGTHTNMNANEVLANRASQLLGGALGTKKPVHPNDHVNKGQSSNDVIPTALHVAALVALRHGLLPALETLHQALQAKADAFAPIIKIGRTHLQDAVPLTLGQEFGGYAAQLRTAGDLLAAASEALRPLALGGTAVGTGLNCHPEMAARTIALLSARTGLNFRADGNRFALLAGREAVVGVSGALKTLATTLMKIANDIRLLASGPRCGLGELILPANEPGSSMMPGKVNPSQCEMLVQVAAQVMGNDLAITVGGSWGFLELNLMQPLLIANLLESIDILTRGMNSFTDRCLRGITANQERIAALVEQSLMLATALTPIKKIGYDQAAALAQRAYREGKTIRELVLEEKLLTPEELAAALDLRKMVAGE